MRAKVVMYPDQTSLMAGAAERLVAEAQAAIAERGRWMWALAGGSTPKGAYELLAQEPHRSQIDWSRVHVFWGDERCVPPDHAESNYAMAYAALLKHVSIPEQQIHRLRGELAPETAAQLYERELREAFDLADVGGQQWPIFDTVLLGLGGDGHTASLFPDTAVLEHCSSIVAETWVPKLQASRLTLTLPTLNQARQVLFLVAGSDKAPVVKAIIAGAPEEQAAFPAARVKTRTPAHWLLDSAAAQQLPAGLGESSPLHT